MRAVSVLPFYSRCGSVQTWRPLLVLLAGGETAAVERRCIARLWVRGSVCVYRGERRCHPGQGRAVQPCAHESVILLSWLSGCALRPLSLVLNWVGITPAGCRQIMEAWCWSCCHCCWSKEKATSLWTRAAQYIVFLSSSQYCTINTSRKTAKPHRLKKIYIFIGFSVL